MVNLSATLKVRGSEDGEIAGSRILNVRFQHAAAEAKKIWARWVALTIPYPPNLMERVACNHT